MNQRLLKISKRIRSELEDLDLVVRKIREAWQRCIQSEDDYYMDSVIEFARPVFRT